MEYLPKREREDSSASPYFSLCPTDHVASLHFSLTLHSIPSYSSIPLTFGIQSGELRVPWNHRPSLHVFQSSRGRGEEQSANIRNGPTIRDQKKKRRRWKRKNGTRSLWITCDTPNTSSGATPSLYVFVWITTCRLLVALQRITISSALPPSGCLLPSSVD